MKNNFYLVRYFVGEEMLMAHKIKIKDLKKFEPFLEEIHNNIGGGLTYWYRIQLDKKKYKKLV